MKTADANAEDQFEGLYHKYFDTLEKYIPKEKQGNFYSTGHDILRNHLMAHLNHKEKKNYTKLVKILVEKSYYHSIDDEKARILTGIVAGYFQQVETFILSLVEKEKPTRLGISVYGDTVPLSLLAFKLVKKKHPHIKTLMGGGVFADHMAVGSPNYEVFLEKTRGIIDTIIIGEGENLFLKYLKGEFPQSQRVLTQKELDGKTLELSRVGMPDFSDFSTDKYLYLTTYFSRSCPYQCSFCAETVNWGAYRKKNVSQCIDELSRLHRISGRRLFLIGDSLLNPIITELSHSLKESRLQLYWDGYLRAEKHVCNRENTRLWRQAGFYRARLGIESGSQHVLDLMGKKVTLSQVKDAITSLAQAGIKTTTYWITGHPGETEDDFQQTLRLLDELKDVIYEAEGKPFKYFLSGQVGSDYWINRYNHVPLYPEKDEEMLMFQTWSLDCEPSREVAYQRSCRFNSHCRKLGIPNPYSMYEIYRADERWKKLHPNAVPPFLEIRELEEAAGESVNEGRNRATTAGVPTPATKGLEKLDRKKILAATSQYGKECDFWLKKLAGEWQKSTFPYDYPAFSSETGETGETSLNINIPAQLAAKLVKLSKGSDKKLHMILLTGLVLLLHKYTANEDIVIGTPIYRQKVEGDFINTLLPLRHKITAGMTVKELLLQVRDVLVDAAAHQNYPLEVLVHQLNMEYSTTSFPLFDMVLLMENIQPPKYIAPICPNLLFSVTSKKDHISGILGYNARIYEAHTVEAINSRWIRILEEMTDNVNRTVAGFQLLTEAEKRRLLEKFNDTAAGYPVEKTIRQLFEEQVERTPASAAVAAPGGNSSTTRQLTYSELNNKANTLAYRLITGGVKPGDIAAVMAEPSAAMITAILAIIKAGAVYLPLNPQHPHQRIRQIIKDSAAVAALTQTGFSQIPCDVAVFDIDDDTTSPHRQENPVNSTRPGDPLYTVYTSGTSGKPKGVLINNKNLVNYISWFSAVTHPAATAKALLLSSYAFDLGNTVIYAALLNGGELHLLERDTYLDTRSLVDYIAANEIGYIKITPSFFSVIVDTPGFSGQNCSSLRLIVLGGEALDVSDVKKTFRKFPGTRIMNHYGPSETTIGSVAQYIDPLQIESYEKAPTIGTPIANTRTYILDRDLQLVPPGVAGELYIAGDGVGRGYLNRPELTSEKFVPDPYHTNTLLYRTGDLARHLADGYIQFLGRIDQQVKIRGFRIELGEIETRLLKHPDVNEAVVLVRKTAAVNDDGTGEEKFLCAYFTSSKDIDITQLQEFLNLELPNYMLPTFFLPLDSLPLTPNGKLDREALPEPELAAEDDFEAPGDETDKQVLRVWARVLGIEEQNIGLNSNFFGLGGHSLKATTVLSELHKVFDVKIPLVEIF
ncbi:MAG: amino acid adenylation domain-containing protein, partial [bacterium]|nr:amino acid adenylation domain-containing protein [bacterium]